MKKLAGAVALVFAAVAVGVVNVPAAEAQVGNSWTTSPNPWGGSTTRDNRGNSWTTSPNPWGGSTTRDNRGNSCTTTRNPWGGTTTRCN